MGYVYLGESARGRILRYGYGFAQVGATYQLEARTWPLRPAGDTGDVAFRRVTALVRHTLGYNVRLTAWVDGVLVRVKTFSGGAPSGGRQEDTVQCSLPVFKRGSAVEALFETVALFGETELVDLQSSHIVIRQEP